MSETETVTSAAGIEQLRRRWKCADPRAAVLIVHGVAEHCERYEHLGDELVRAGFDVASFDLRGHGHSGGRRGHIDSFDDYLDDVEELLAERRDLGVPVILLGHSLGGLICTTYVVRGRPAPDLLVLSAPALAAQVPGWQRAASSIIGRVAPTVPVPNDLDGELLSRDPAVGRAYTDDPLRVRKATAGLGHQLFSTMDATSAALDAVTIPTYVLHGSEDQLVPPSASAGFEAVPTATRVVHEGLRHECFNEPERDEVIAAMVAWMDTKLPS